VHTGSGSREPASNPGEKQRGKARRPLASHRIAGRSCCEHVGIADADPSTATCGSVDGWISGTRRCRPCYPPSLLLLLLLPAYVQGPRAGKRELPLMILSPLAWLVRSAARAAAGNLEMDGSTRDRSSRPRAARRARRRAGRSSGLVPCMHRAGHSNSVLLWMQRWVL
jgi:hypothetical protein